ncbi:MAG TPA: hypothetical protein VM223_01210, partial [Planctomycetota bacterium]|nr:hypothetical protein [Planctomycetota bacterium]
LAGEAMLKRTVSATMIADVLEHALSIQEPDTLPVSLSYKVGHLLDVIEADAGIDRSRAAKLEWGFMPIMVYHGRRPRVLHEEMSRDPSFFVSLVTLVFRGENEEPRKLSEEEQGRAHVAYQLLNSWRTVPGLQPSGAVDYEQLRDWVQVAREELAQGKRTAIGDQTIGQVLSGSAHGSDGAWPHEAVREVIEYVASEDLETGIAIGKHNSRGVVTRDPADGGKLERELAKEYETYATAVSTSWPRTAAMLRQMANTYRREALHEDQETELRSDLDQ